MGLFYLCPSWLTRQAKRVFNSRHRGEDNANREGSGQR